MSLDVVRIEPKVAGKGRSFRASCVAYVLADSLWDGGLTDSKFDRPVYATFLGSDAELRPFVANLMLGRGALGNSNSSYRSKGFEFLKSAGFKYTWQREDEGSLVTVFLPELFLLDPGMVDPKVARFVVLPPAKWAAQQALDLAAIVKHCKKLPLVRALNTAPVKAYEYDTRPENFKPLMAEERMASLAATAYLFASYLDRRTRAPLPADGRFYLQLMLACLKNGLASFASVAGDYSNEKTFGKNGLGFKESNMAVAGFLPGVAFKATHEDLEKLLAEEIALFFKMAKGK